MSIISVDLYFDLRSEWPVWRLFVFFFNDTATTEIYTLSLPTLFRSHVGVIIRNPPKEILDIVDELEDEEGESMRSPDDKIGRAHV